jgi:hypothetical protein
MLEPIHQNEGTTERERYLGKLASSQFFSLWSYPGLVRRGKKGINKELADLTVIFGDDIVLFSDKDIAWPSHSDIMVAWSRWFRAAVVESAAQLWGAEKHLRSSDPSIYLDARCEIPFPFPSISPQTRIHLIAVASNSIEPARKYFDAHGVGSSGTLMHAFGLPEYAEGNHPFVVGDLNSNKPFIHILDEETLDRLLLELGTISDFIHYVTEKERAIRSGRLIHYAGEEELLGFYLQEQTPIGYGSLPFAYPRTARDDMSVTIPEGEWNAYVDSDAYRVRSQLKERARQWFDLIEPFSTAVLSAQTGEANETPLDMHELVLRMAASENLASRARLATAFVEKYESVPPEIRTSRVAACLCHPGRLYVFLFVPWIYQSASYAEYRAYRLQLMKCYATVVPIKFPGVREVLVVGAQTHDATGTRSETMIYTRYDQLLSPAEIAEATKLMEAESILADLPIQPLGIGSNAAVEARRFGRNERCPCGSLKKNKKCCNITGARYGTTYQARIR